MTLSDAQQDALLTLANTASGHDFVPQTILDELVSMELVYWRTPDEVILTAAGERIYQKLAAELSGEALPVSFA
jgi:hypothetical protein